MEFDAYYAKIIEKVKTEQPKMNYKGGKNYAGSL